MLSHHSALISALEYLRTKYLRPKLRKYVYDKKYFKVGRNRFNKKLVSIYKKSTNLSRKEVRLNYEASKVILSLISSELSSKGIKFGVMIIPSDLIIIGRWAANNSGVEMPKNFSVKHEKKLIENYIAFLNKKGIPVIDATPFVFEAFTESMELKEKFYSGRHPLSEGYFSYSKAAAELISKINKNVIKAAD